MGKILHLSDIHFGCENKAAVAAAGECAHKGGFDLIAITGDITQYGHEEEFDAAKAFVDGLPQPILMTPGNHDTPWFGMVDRIVQPFARYERRFGPAWSSGLDGEGFAARAFNTARGVQVRLNWSKGAVAVAQARRVADSLMSAPGGALRVALCHHPLMEVVGGPMTAKVRGGGAAVGILARGGIDVVLTGHVHTPFALPLPCEDGKSYAVGAGTLSVRERGMPPAFNIVEWNDETINVTAQAWSGSVFEPLRSWTLSRRAAPGT